MHTFTYLWTLKIITIEQENTTETNSQIQRTNRWFPKGREVERQMKEVKGIKRYKLPAIIQISHEDIIYNINRGYSQ